MPAPSLLRIAKRTCVRNIKAIVDVGDVPYEVVRDVLIRVENPDQLRQIELVSPQVCGEDAEIWMGYIKRDISGWAEKPHQPKNPKNWYKVYQKLRMESQAEVDRDTSKLRAAMEGRMAEKGKNTSKLVDMADLPGLGKNTQFGRRTRRTAGQGSTLSSSSSTLTFTSGSKTKNVMQKVRREAREMSLFSHQNSKLSQPTHLLNGQSSKVRSAPRGLVDEHRRPAPPIESPKRKAPVVFPPRGMLTKPPTQNPAKNASSGDASKAAEKTPTNAVSQETECRLNEFTSRHVGRAGAKETTTATSSTKTPPTRRPSAPRSPTTPTGTAKKGNAPSTPCHSVPLLGTLQVKEKGKGKETEKVKESEKQRTKSSHTAPRLNVAGTPPTATAAPATGAAKGAAARGTPSPGPSRLKRKEPDVFMRPKKKPRPA